MNAPEVLQDGLDHPLQAAPHLREEAADFFTEAAPLFAGSLFCLIREDKTKLDAEEEAIKKDPTIRPKPKVIHTTALSEEARLDYQRAGYGIFFTVNAFRDGKRDAEHLEALKALYVDIDAPKALKDPGALDTLVGKENLRDWKRGVFAALTGAEHEARKTFPYLPTLVVETKNGFHAYWYLESFIPFTGEEHKEAEEDPSIRLYAKTIQQLIKLYGGDPVAKDVSRVLRSPYSWHIKSGKEGAFPCRPAFWDDSSRAELEDYASCFKQEATSTSSESPEEDSFVSHFVRAVSPSEELSPADKAEIDAEVLAKYPKRERPSIRGLMNPTGTPEGSRNASLFCVVSALREDGFSRDQVESEFRATGYNGLKDAEILSVIASAYKSIRPKSFGWNDPIASAYRTPEEEAQVKALYREAIQKRVKAKKVVSATSADTQPSATQPAPPTSILPKPLDGDRGAPNLAVSTQKTVYATVEHELAKMLPDIKSLEGHGIHRKRNGIYEPISKDDLMIEFVKCFRALNLTSFCVSHAVSAKIPAWASLEEVRIKRDLIEPGVGHTTTLSSEDVLPLANGVLSLKTQVLRPYRDEEAWRFTSPISFDENATCPKWENFIKQVTQDDFEKAEQLQEIFGYCLTSSIAHQVGFVLLGEGSNGKSVFASTIQHILGKKLQGSLTMDTLQSNFGIGNIEGKRLNVVNEISDHYLRGDVFKRLIDGSEITADQKNKAHKVFNPFAKFLFTINRLPQVDEASQAIFRRLMIVKFNRIFRGSEVNHSLERELRTEAPGILNWALVGLERLRNNGEFTQTKEQELAMNEFKENSSRIIPFLLETFYPIESTDIAYATSYFKLSVFREKLTKYCLDNNYHRLGTKRVLTDLNSLIVSNNLPKDYQSIHIDSDKNIYGLKFKP